MPILCRICASFLSADARQQEPDDIAFIEVTAVVGQGVPCVKVGAVSDGAIGLRLGIVGIGLRPPTPSSVEPSGTPIRPTPDGDDIVLGDDDAADPIIPAQVPDAVAAMPPASKSAVVAEPIGPDIVALGDVPDRFPAAELMKEHAGVVLVVGVIGDTPDVVGLTPSDPISLLPRGIPVGGTAGAGPMPRGEVMPSGDGTLAPICADAVPKPMINAIIAVISMCVMAISCG